MKKYNVVIVGGGSHRNPDLMAMLADNKVYMTQNQNDRK